MQEWAGNLLALQELDLHLARIDAELKRLDERFSEENAALLQAHVPVAQAESKALALEKILTTLAKDAEGIDAAKLDLKKKTAFIRKNDEYQAALAQLERFDEELDRNLTNQLEKLEEAKEARQMLDDLRRSYEEAGRKFLDFCDELKALRRRLGEEARTEAEKRPGLAAAVEVSLLQRYERLRAERAANPLLPWVVTVGNSACGRCHRQLTPQRYIQVKKGELVFCENCGAVLYYEE